MKYNGPVCIMSLPVGHDKERLYQRNNTWSRIMPRPEHKGQLQKGPSLALCEHSPDHTLKLFTAQLAPRYPEYEALYYCTKLTQQHSTGEASEQHTAMVYFLRRQEAQPTVAAAPAPSSNASHSPYRYGPRNIQTAENTCDVEECPVSNIEEIEGMEPKQLAGLLLNFRNGFQPLLQVR
ncbi:unnamed protein product [Nezara viridula]|uniref:Uncharacterized protein n=1 Tax=Nezara viridula TaxID=85310 RepID=A0A9P0HEE8_NEZVI|nr:unnamed protein product [Nezara viridula]